MDTAVVRLDAPRASFHASMFAPDTKMKNIKVEGRTAIEQLYKYSAYSRIGLNRPVPRPTGAPVPTPRQP